MIVPRIRFVTRHMLCTRYTVKVPVNYPFGAVRCAIVSCSEAFVLSSLVSRVRWNRNPMTQPMVTNDIRNWKQKN